MCYRGQKFVFDFWGHSRRLKKFNFLAPATPVAISIHRLRRSIQLAFVLRLVVLAPLACSAQTVEKEISFRSKRWTTEEGLPQNRISCLKQTRDGSLWIGTWFGLTRFDGIRFTTFTKANTPELRDDAIKFLVEDNSGTLWIGTRDGVVSYHDKFFQALTMDVEDKNGTGKRRDAVYMTVSPSGDFWVRSLKTVQQFRGGKFSPPINLPRARSMFPMVSEKSGGLNLLNPPLWLEISPRGALTTNGVVGLPNCEWLSAFPSSEKSFWIGTSAGLFHLKKQPDSSVQATFDASLGNLPVQFVYQDRSSNVWVNPISGKFKRCLNPGMASPDSGVVWNNLNLGDEFSGSSVNCMEEDSEGNFWIGTDRGLFQLQMPRVRVFSSRDGLPHDNVRSVCEASDGTIWCYTDKGLGRIRGDRVVNFELAELWSHNRAMCAGRNGNIWVANREHGICEIEGDKFVTAIPGQQISGAIDVLYEDKSGRLWSGSSSDLTILDNGKIISGEELTGQPIAGVYSIFETRDKTLWFASKELGLVRWRDGKKTIFTERDGLSCKQIWAIHEDMAGALWLGGDNGLVRFKDGKFTTFHRQQGLSEETINCILEDDLRFLWLSGLQGIYRTSLNELDAVADGRAMTFRCITFGTADGMESAETNGETQPAGCKSRDGRLWFPTIRGLVVIDPANIGADISPTSVLIEKVKADGDLIFGEDLSATNKIKNNFAALSRGTAAVKIPPGQSDVVEFQYTANSFANPNRTRFRYRLDGTDSQWREETTERTVRYINLNPGDYRFEVVAADHHGIWSATPATFAFSIAPHFWQRWQFYLAGVLIVVGLAISVHRYRLHWQRRVLKLDEQRALSLQRSRIARDLHDDLGAALTGLALEIDVVGRENSRASTITERLGETAQRTRELAERMREVVWATNPRCDTASSLADFLEEQISHFLRNADILVDLEFPEEIPSIPIDGDARHQITLSVREGLANIVRHARATCVEARLEFTDKTVLLSLKDNGRGFNPETVAGNGLGNMRSRMEQIGGTFQCISHPGAGTEIRFCVPLSNNLAASRKSAFESK